MTPFSVVDELSCYYDAPGEPNNVHLEMLLPGLLDEGTFRAAAAEAIDRVPRARARRVRTRTGFAWQMMPRPDAEPVAVVSWTSPGELDRLRVDFFATAPALDTAPPLRLLLARGPGQSCVMLNAHHAAFDGLSCLELLRSIAGAYTSRSPAADGGGRPGSERDSQPADSGTTPGSRAGSDDGAAGSPDAPSAPRSLVTRIAPVPSAEGAGYGFRLLPPLTVPVAPATTAGEAVTVNDMLISALIATIGRWNASQGRPADNVKVTMPINYMVHAGEPRAGNFTRLATICAPGNDPAAILGSVVRQTRWAKGHPGPQVDPFYRALAAAPVPAAVKRLALRTFLRSIGPFVCDTTLLSNLGNVADPPRFGALTPTRMAFSTSAHMPRGLSVGVIGQAGELQLCVRYRYALFTDAAAAQFADLLRTEFSRLAEVSRLEG